MRHALCIRTLIDRSRREGGFTLIEVLVGTALGLVILTAVFQVLIVGIHRQHQVDTRTGQLQSAQTAVDGLSRDLRQATSVTVAARSLTYVVKDKTSQSNVTVTWACSASNVCTRSVGGKSRVAISNVTNSTVFTLSNSNYVTFTFTVAATGRNAITVANGVALRNLATTTS